MSLALVGLSMGMNRSVGPGVRDSTRLNLLLPLSERTL